MKQVNFKELNVEVGVDTFMPQDLRKDVGNVLHQASESVPMSELARNIYYSEGALDISDEDYQVMMFLLSKAMKKFVNDAILRSTVEIKEK